MGSGTFSYLQNQNNLAVAAAASITSSSAATNYPAANATTLPIGKSWRATGKTSEWIEIDLGSAQAINLFGIINHNISSSGTVTVTAGSSAAPNGSQYSLVLTYRQFDEFSLLAVNQTWRYWRFTFADTTNVDGFIRVGYVIIGNATTPGFHWQYDSEFTDHYVNTKRRSAGGVVFAQAIYGHAVIKFNFGPLSVANMAILRAVYRAQRAEATPLFIIPESNLYDGYFGRFINDMIRRLNIYEWATLWFEEDDRGRSLTS